MRSWISPKKHSSFGAVDSCINPMCPCLQCLSICICHFQSVIHMIPFLKVVTPKQGKLIKNHFLEEKKSATEDWYNLYTLWVFWWVHQWPVLKMIMSASWYLVREPWIVSRRRVSRRAPALSENLHSWTRNGDFMKSIEHLKSYT